MGVVRHARTSATIYEYQPLHITAAQANATPVGKNSAATTTATTITGGTTTAIVVASATNILKGMKLYIKNGATIEAFTVLSVAGTTVTATAAFVNSYAGTSQIGSNNGTLMGAIIVNKAGDATCALTLYNGNPNLAGGSILPADYGSTIGILTNPSVAGNYQYGCVCDYGLFYTLAFSTAPDITIMWDDATHPLTL